MGKILVLGEGLVGSTVRDHLQKNSSYEIETLAKSSVDLCNLSDFELLLEKIKPEIVIIAAGVVGGFEKNCSEPYLLGLENSKIILNVIEACIKQQILHVLNLVPASVYPANIEKRMIPEDLWKGPMDVTSLPYVLAKLLGITLVGAARSQHKVNWISVIATNLYGDDSAIESHKAHVIPSLLEKFNSAKKVGTTEIVLLGDGRPIREFLHVDDFASAIAFILENRLFSEPILNVSGEASCTINELAEVIRRVTNYQGQVLFANDGRNGAMVKLLDGSILHSFGWRPKITLSQGVTRVYAKFKA
jgi:GDP-L-fucose synthase